MFTDRFKKTAAATTLAAATLGGCSDSPKETPSADPFAAVQKAEETQIQQSLPDPVSTLSRFALTTQDGSALNAHQLRHLLEGGHYTVSFGFNGCEAYCPFTSRAFSELDTAYHARNPGKQIRHIVINTKPEIDGATQESRDSYLNSILYTSHHHGANGEHHMGHPQSTGVAKDDVLILYPSSRAEAVQAQIALGARVVTNSPDAHSGKVVLYDGKGNAIAQSTSAKLKQHVPSFIQAMEQSAAQSQTR